MTVVGWTSAYLNDYPEATFTEERRKALVERIRKRRYNFNYSDHQTLSYCAPFYSDKTHCVLTKAQFDSVMEEAYKDIPRGARLMPMDVIEDRPVNDVLYEKKKFMEEYNG
jgi:hypothetical protein